MYRRTVDGQVLDFGTSGLLRFSNLVMYDRQTESWWEEFGGEALVGDFLGKKLEQLPLRIMSWKEFKDAFPRGKVLSKSTGHSRPYGQNPYPNYDSLSRPFLYEGADDNRLPLLERVVGLKIGDKAIAVPFSLLEQKRLVQLTLGGQDVVILHRSGTASSLDDSSIAGGRDVGAVAVFSAQVDGRTLAFRLQGNNLVDQETSTVWDVVQGLAVSGPQTSKRLTFLPHSSAFWFSWSAFTPGTTVYRGT